MPATMVPSTACPLTLRQKNQAAPAATAKSRASCQVLPGFFGAGSKGKRCWEPLWRAWRSICHCIWAWAGSPILQSRPIFFTSSLFMNFIRFSDLCAQGLVKDQRVFIRADLNVPLDTAGHITEDTRIRASLACIRMALDAGAAVMVTSHLGRPTEGEFKPADSLAPVAQRLAELLGRAVPLLSHWVDGVNVQPGELVLLENCRLNPGEKKNNEQLARKMAALCDIFVHDAFGLSLIHI